MSIEYIQCEQLVAHPDNPRLALREDVVAGIAQQIKNSGEFPEHHAILVRPFGDEYQIVHGHHRVEAAQQAGLDAVPAWVREMDDEAAFMELVLGNSQGELKPIEIGMHALKAVRLSQRGRGSKGEGLKAYAEALGKTASYITQLRQAASVLSIINSGKQFGLSDHAKHLAAIHLADQRVWRLLVRALIEKHWSVLDTKRHVDKVREFSIPEHLADIFPFEKVVERYLKTERFTSTVVSQLAAIIDGSVAGFRIYPDAVAKAAIDRFNEWLGGEIGGDAWDPRAIQAKRAEIEAALEKESAEREERHTLIVGDIRSVHEQIEAESVDVIITDPPYPKDYIDLFRDLGQFAAHALKPGGSLIAMVGPSYLPQYIELLSESLSYHWVSAYLTPGGQAVQLWERKVNTFWKPLLWFVKGEYGGSWVGDVCKSDVNDNDKQHHHWGQSESGMADIMERYSKPGDVVCDPFCGGGTTGVVAIAMNRRFIGIDIDESHIDTTRERLQETEVEAA